MDKPKKKRQRDKSGRLLGEYKPEYDALLVEHLTLGLSFESFAAKADVNRATLYAWADRHPSFMDAKERGIMKSLLHWESMGMEGAVGKIPGFSVPTWIFTMKNRFGYRDRQEVKSLGEGEEFSEVITHDKIMAYIEGKKF